MKSEVRPVRFLGSKWTATILEFLKSNNDGEGVRFNKLKDELGVSPKLLAERLEAFQDLGLVENERRSCVPPASLYRLTQKGRDVVARVHRLEATF